MYEMFSASFFLRRTPQLHSLGVTPTPTVFHMGLLLLCWFHMWLLGVHLDPEKHKHKHSGDTSIHDSPLLLFAMCFLLPGLPLRVTMDPEHILGIPHQQFNQIRNPGAVRQQHYALYRHALLCRSSNIYYNTYLFTW